MIVSVEIENFKGIKNRQRIDLAPINLFFGANSAGKSTLLQTLIYFHSILVEGRTEPSYSTLGGKDFDLGGYRQVVFGQNPEKEISIKVELTVAWEWVCKSNEFLFDAMEETNEEIFGENPTVGLELVLKMGSNNTDIVRFRFFRDDDVLLTIDVDQPTKVRKETHYFGGAWWPRSSSFQAELAKSGQEIYGVRLGQLNLHPANIINESDDSQESKIDSFEIELPAGAPRPYFFTKGIESLQETERISDFQKLHLELSRKWINGILIEMVSQLERAIYLGPTRERPTLIGEAGPNINLIDVASGKASWQILHYLDDEQIEQVNLWLGESGLTTGLQIVKGKWKLGWDNNNRDLNRIHFSTDQFVNRDEFDPWFILRSQDIGVGISHVLPIIVHSVAFSTGRIHEKPQLMLIEQPELHLHPKAQTLLGDLFIAKCGLGSSEDLHTQFFLETHSEHLILRILRRIRETSRGTAPDGLSITPDDLAVHYVGKTEDGTKFQKIDISDDGKFIQAWPDDFFDLDFQERFA